MGWTQQDCNQGQSERAGIALVGEDVPDHHGYLTSTMVAITMNRSRILLAVALRDAMAHPPALLHAGGA